MTLLENEIWNRIRSGDEKAFEYLFKSYYSLLCGYAYDLLKNDEMAEEAVQETMIRIWENRMKLDIKTSVKAYLYRSVHNHCVNVINRIKIEKKHSGRYHEDMKQDLKVDNINYPQIDLVPHIYDGIEKDIEAAIQSLPEQCRKIFNMSRFDRMTYKEIATELNISVNTVKTQLRRALEKIRDSIKPNLKEMSNRGSSAGSLWVLMMLF
jgi:RNA polymerase sigma-70 factor, ECF subfamily